MWQHALWFPPIHPGRCCAAAKGSSKPGKTNVIHVFSVILGHCFQTQQMFPSHAVLWHCHMWPECPFIEVLQHHYTQMYFRNDSPLSFTYYFFLSHSRLQITRSWNGRLGFVACWNIPTLVRRTCLLLVSPSSILMLTSRLDCAWLDSSCEVQHRRNAFCIQPERVAYAVVSTACTCKRAHCC